MSNTQRSFVNPFSPKFMETWDLWKGFKQEEWGFEYKGVISEQMAVKHLVDLSEGDEEKAIKIICQSIRRKWQGFWPLKETTHGTKKEKSNSKAGDPDFRNKVQAAFNKRYEGGEQDGSGSHLKAV